MPRIRVGRRKGRSKNAIQLLRELPNFIKLLARLFSDIRVPKLDRALFVFVLTYVMLPFDLLPDVLGFMGLVDDLYLIGLALNRLFSRAGPDILLEHWDGNPRALGFLLEAVEDMGALLPAKIRNALRRLV